MEIYRNILQIMPATDWLAVYDDSADDVEPIVCFALVEVTKDRETYREICAMVPDGRMISFADEASNFTGVKHARHSNPA